MSTKTERAVLAGGCFWGVQELLITSGSKMISTA